MDSDSTLSPSPSKDISAGQEEIDEIIAARGVLTDDERDYYIDEYGIKL
jgi:hypothetical protein